MEKEIFIVDFGSQTTHLIGRRLRDLGLMIRIIEPGEALGLSEKQRPAGIILSGGPASVYEAGAPMVDRRLFTLGIPILGICYGWQLTAHFLGGKVVSGKKEYGPGTIRLKNQKAKIKISENLPQKFTVWLSHGDSVVRLPPDFEIIGSTSEVKAAFVVHPQRKIFGVQFHPEVVHTEFGGQILKQFGKICGLKPKPQPLKLEKIIEEIRETVGKEAKVVAAVSGGLDSTTMAVLVARAVGRRFFPVYIENGLMRQGNREELISLFKKFIGFKPKIIQAERLFLKKLKGVTNPERKRKIIGRLYVSLFQEEAKKIKGVKFLAQGTIYSDVIESKGSKNAAMIKSHHNVGGLPKSLKLKLLEPLRHYYKDEVRSIAKQLGLPPDLINKQPFPGPGNAIRIIGEVRRSRLVKLRQADAIVLAELKKAGWLAKVFQSFAVMTGVKSTAVKGDSRFYGEVVALRVYTSSDIMTSDWARLPYDLLQKIASRIVNEVPGISRVVYDITTKPPATMEWE